ncbi:MAG: dihydrofolate reductase [Verrucomicrobiaceae bacterium]|nr:dihydrofolate reductase [Verrucomicrobiaceae bacterium]
MSLTVTLIAAVSADGFISRGKGVPWDLPADRAHFRSYTAGKWLLLGRTTYEEMRGWFRDHTPLVLSRDAGFQPPKGRRVSTAREAIDLAVASAQPEIVVCGGAQIYAAALPHATRLILTRVDERLASGLSFPLVNADDWHVVSTDPLEGCPACRIEHLERRDAGAGRSSADTRFPPLRR